MKKAILVFTILYSIFFVISCFISGIFRIGFFMVIPFLCCVLICFYLKKSIVSQALKLIFSLVFIFYFGIMVFIFLNSKSDYLTYKEDCLIVLGCGLKGKNLSQSLKERLDKALEYIDKNKNAIIFVSGGQGENELITEALAMQRYLVEKGVEEKRIVMEDRSTSTYENFKYSKNILDSIFKGNYSCVFVTNSFHLYRASKIGEIVGLDVLKLRAKTSPYSLIDNYFREVLAVIKLWILKR